MTIPIDYYNQGGEKWAESTLDSRVCRVWNADGN